AGSGRLRTPPTAHTLRLALLTRPSGSGTHTLASLWVSHSTVTQATSRRLPTPPTAHTLRLALMTRPSGSGTHTLASLWVSHSTVTQTTFSRLRTPPTAHTLRLALLTRPSGSGTHALEMDNCQQLFCSQTAQSPTFPIARSFLHPLLSISPVSRRSVFPPPTALKCSHVCHLPRL
ncbi:hypothetical protein FRC10_004063, partial [Ceratobasidium sp. 414]